ncbi:MAG TPA: AraC family transcriptional regulator [Arachidicoccus sp.]|nr:AraC family transcriptional regulator [Arachidicoccus sp.]
MKPILLKSNSSPEHSFSIEERVSANFSIPYHFHNEYELTAILKGKGSRFVGNNISSFQDKDMVLIGKNLPHHWYNDKDTSEQSNDAVRAIILKFDSDFNGIRLFELPENYQLQKLLGRAANGLKIEGNTFYSTLSLMESLLHATGPERISLLLKILSEISNSENLEELSNGYYITPIKENDLDRMNRVYEYIMKNYLETISLEEAASIACMNKAAFCKYFKKRYSKTFIQVVNEIRISHACRELMKEETNVTEACYESGFNNISNFTKTFKKIIGTSPRAYKMKIKGLPH